MKEVIDEIQVIDKEAEIDERKRLMERSKEKEKKYAEEELKEEEETDVQDIKVEKDKIQEIETEGGLYSIWMMIRMIHDGEMAKEKMDEDETVDKEG